MVLPSLVESASHSQTFDNTLFTYLDFLLTLTTTTAITLTPNPHFSPSRCRVVSRLPSVPVWGVGGCPRNSGRPVVTVNVSCVNPASGRVTSVGEASAPSVLWPCELFFHLFVFALKSWVTLFCLICLFHNWCVQFLLSVVLCFQLEFSVCLSC